jgi:hypothetical protein
VKFALLDKSALTDSHTENITMELFVIYTRGFGENTSYFLMIGNNARAAIMTAFQEEQALMMPLTYAEAART